MIIDDKTYKLNINNYTQIESQKKQIVLGNTFNDDMKHLAGWNTKYNGKYKKTAAFTISKNGQIYKHFDPKYYSSYFNTNEQNIKSILILIENYGWLIKDNKKNTFNNWLGGEYTGDRNILEKKWRDYMYWEPYNNEQLESTIYLILKLCSEFNIPKIAIGHNTKIDDLYEFEGVLYKSNIEKHYTDLNPNWKFDIFKEKVEL
jgi:N-acetyl-anhydromuramyl-L-alanine amidase AmpD